MAMAKLSGRKLYYEKHGDWASDATPLLLIMGMAGSCQGWAPLQLPVFSPTRPVLVYDHRGVGQSEDDGKEFTIADLAEDAVELLDALGIARVDVLGAFMGGMTAQEIALLHPARVGRLVLVGTYARADAKRRMLLEHWCHLAMSETPAKTMVYNRLLWTLQDETLEQTDLIHAMMNFYTKERAPVPSELFIRQCRAAMAHDTLDRIGSLQHRALILCGRNDLLTPPKLHRELADGIPDSQLVTLAYGGHLIMVESAESFNQIVLQFLDDAR
jgi:pimeloyl-ACP methyl ester carboxylesterase